MLNSLSILSTFSSKSTFSNEKPPQRLTASGILYPGRQPMCHSMAKYSQARQSDMDRPPQIPVTGYIPGRDDPVNQWKQRLTPRPMGSAMDSSAKKGCYRKCGLNLCPEHNLTYTKLDKGWRNCTKGAAASRGEESRRGEGQGQGHGEQPGRRPPVYGRGQEGSQETQVAIKRNRHVVREVS